MSQHKIPRDPDLWMRQGPVFSLSDGRREQLVGMNVLSKLGWDNLEDALILFGKEHPTEAQVFVDWLQREPDATTPERDGGTTE